MTNPRKSLKTVLLRTYARVLLSALNDFVKDSGLIHTTEPIKASTNALLVIKTLEQGEPRKIAQPGKVIQFEEPLSQDGDITYGLDEIRIYKPCHTYDDLYGWSNVAAFLDSDRIIAEILSAPRQVDY